MHGTLLITRHIGSAFPATASALSFALSSRSVTLEPNAVDPQNFAQS